MPRTRRSTIREAVLGVTLLASVSARGQPPATPEGPTPEELEEIEAALGADAAARSATANPTPAAAPVPSQPALSRGLQSLNPDIAFIFDSAVAYFSDREPLQTGAHDATKTGFNWQQLEGSISGAVDPYFRFDAFLVFGPFGVEVEEAVATTLALPASLQLRMGMFLTRFGRLNSTHPHAWDFADQPFAIGRVFGAESNRGLGFELSYLTPLPWYVEAVVSATDAAGEASARSFYGGTDLGVDTPLDVQVTAALKQFFPFSDALGLSWGLSVAAGPNPTGHRNRTEVYGTDLYLKYRPLDAGAYTTVALQTEWIYRRRQVPHDVLSDLNGYSYVLWRFARRWSVSARYELGTPVRGQSGSRAADDLDPFWTGHRQRITGAVSFLPTEFSRIRLQVGSDVPRWRPNPIWSVLLATEFLLGAHGAHKY